MGHLPRVSEASDNEIPSGSSSRRCSATSPPMPHVNTWQLIGIIFFAATGGPYGFEDTIGAGGAPLTFIALVLIPCIWSIPLALLTAELSCMIPESGGNVVWVHRAFGPFWAFFNGCIASACSILDNALYPVLFIDYVNAITFNFEEGNGMSSSLCMLIKVALAVSVAVVNICGIDLIGTASLATGLIVLSPFTVMVLLGLRYLSLEWGPSSSPHPVRWGRFITVLLWNTSGYDAAGSCAREVKDPGRSYPYALAASMVLMVLSYGLPALVGVSVIRNYRFWRDGTFVAVARSVGGRPLQVWIAVSAAVSATAMLMTRVCTSSRSLYAMAKMDQIPSVFGSLHKTYMTPWVAVLVISFFTVALSGLDFTTLAEVDMVLYGMSTVLKFAALVYLRYAEPEAPRPFRIPVSRGALAALTVIPVTLCMGMIVFATGRAQGIALAGATSTVLLYIVKNVCSVYLWPACHTVKAKLMGVRQNTHPSITQKLVQDGTGHRLRAMLRHLRLLPREGGYESVSGPSGHGRVVDDLDDSVWRRNSRKSNASSDIVTDMRTVRISGARTSRRHDDKSPGKSPEISPLPRSFQFDFSTGEDNFYGPGVSTGRMRRISVL